MPTLEQVRDLTRPTRLQGSHFAIPLAHLAPETVLGFDLFIRHGPHNGIVLFRSRNLPYTREVQERLLDSGVRELLVPGDQRDAYDAYREAHGSGPAREVPSPTAAELELADIVVDRSVPIRSRAATLLGVSRTVIELALSDLKSPGLGERTLRVAQSTARFLVDEPRSFTLLVSLIESDLDAYRHSLRTALYAAQLARACGEDDEARMAAIGRAAMVHDVGRGELPLEYLHKSGGLSDLDWAEVTMHPSRGAAIIGEAGVHDPLCVDVCENHHERCDGSGYPRGLHREQISLPARIVAITDIFDSLTSSGRNHVALSGFQALWRLKQDMRGQFDPELVDTFIRVMVAPR